MVEAKWNGVRIADSDDTVIVEGNHYFPEQSVDTALLRPSGTTSICPWKGTAHYYSLHVAGADNPDAAWYCPIPSPKRETSADASPFGRESRSPDLVAPQRLRAASRTGSWPDALGRTLTAA